MFFSPLNLLKNALNDFFGRFFNLTGRLNRVAFITVFLMFLIFYINVLPWMSNFGLSPRFVQDVTTLYILFVAAVFMFASVRRIHDVGFPIGALLVFAVPNIGFLLGVLLLLAPGEPNTNRFGPVDGDAGLAEMLQKNWFNRQ